MTQKKNKYSPPPSDRTLVENRLVDGKLRKVETYKGKIARVYDNYGRLIDDRTSNLGIKLGPPLRMKPKLEENKSSDDTLSKIEENKPGIDIIPEEDMMGTYTTKRTESKEAVDVPTSEICPECKSKNTEAILHLDKIDRFKCKDCEEIFVVNKSDDSQIETEQKIDKTEEMIQKISSIDTKETIDNTQTQPQPEVETEQEEALQEIKQDERRREEIKLENIQDMTIPDSRIIDRLDQIVKDKTIIQQEEKAKEYSNFPNKDDKIIIKEDKNMAEEIEEFKREKWAKQRDFEKNVEDMTRVAKENKDQISGISNKITNVEGKLNDVENKFGNLQQNLQDKFGTIDGHLQDRFKNLHERLGDIKKPVSDTLGELCTGVDCIKNDIKKSQETQTQLEKKMEDKFEQLKEKLKKLEEPTFVCDNCGQDGIKPLSSFCSNCGTPIHQWSDPETGHNISGWVPYWKRFGSVKVEDK